MHDETMKYQASRAEALRLLTSPTDAERWLRENLGELTSGHDVVKADWFAPRLLAAFTAPLTEAVTEGLGLGKPTTMSAEPRAPLDLRDGTEIGMALQDAYRETRDAMEIVDTLYARIGSARLVSHRPYIGVREDERDEIEALMDQTESIYAELADLADRLDKRTLLFTLKPEPK